MWCFFCFLMNSNCFNRIGMHIPSFLYRVFLLLTEFNSFQEKAKNRFPVAPTTNFALYVCNNREPSQHGLQRCIDIKDALLSLIQKGHQLSSATLLSGSDMLASPHRHVSMDSSDVLFQSFEPSIQSHTPLLHPHSYFESRAYSVEDLPDSSWTSEFSFSNNLSSLPAVSTSALPTRPFELSDSGEAELWNQPIPMWTSQERSLRHSVGSGSLFRDSPAERRRSNSVNVIHSPPSLFRSTYSSTPLSAVPSSFNFFTPSQGSLSLHDVDRIDDFSLGERAMYKRSIGSEDVRSGSDLNLEENLHLMKPLNVEPPRVTSTLNPNSAEFIPNSKKAIKPANRSETDHGKPGVKRRDLLEQTMLQQRIVENRILTLKLRGLPYTVGMISLSKHRPRRRRSQPSLHHSVFHAIRRES